MYQIIILFVSENCILIYIYVSADSTNRIITFYSNIIKTIPKKSLKFFKSFQSIYFHEEIHEKEPVSWWNNNLCHRICLPGWLQIYYNSWNSLYKVDVWWLYSFTKKAVGEKSGVPLPEPITVEKWVVSRLFPNLWINCPLLALEYTSEVTRYAPCVWPNR